MKNNTIKTIKNITLCIIGFALLRICGIYYRQFPAIILGAALMLIAVINLIAIAFTPNQKGITHNDNRKEPDSRE